MNILLLDDDLSCLEGLVSVLEPAGHICFPFNIPEKAVEAYAEGPYDVVITDMRMPGMNGIEVLCEILAIDQDAKVIIVTGYGDVDTAIAAVNNRAYAFFGKPLDVSDLMEILYKIEKETKKQHMEAVDQLRMSDELCRLKRAYVELRSLIEATGVTTS